MDIYTHVTYEHVFKDGTSIMHHNDACFANVIGAHTYNGGPKKVIYSPTILPYYMMANLVGYGSIINSSNAALEWTKILNMMFPSKDPIFTSASGHPITYNVPEEARKHIGIFKLHLFMMRHAFNQPQVLNYLKILYGNKAGLTPHEIYKGCLFLSGFEQLKFRWGTVYDNIHNIFGRGVGDQLKYFKYRPYEEYLKQITSTTWGNVAESWYDPEKVLGVKDPFPVFDKKWEDPSNVRNDPTNFRIALRSAFEQFVKINEENTVCT